MHVVAGTCINYDTLKENFFEIFNTNCYTFGYNKNHMDK